MSIRSAHSMNRRFRLLVRGRSPFLFAIKSSKLLHLAKTIELEHTFMLAAPKRQSQLRLRPSADSSSCDRLDGLLSQEL
jgi:hypothetical protein